MTQVLAPLVGMRHHPGAAEALSEMGMGERLALKREPDNAFDENAIQVFTYDPPSNEVGKCVLLGYIARDHAARWAPVFDEQGTVPAATLSFGSDGRPQVSVEIEGEEENEDAEE